MSLDTFDPEALVEALAPLYGFTLTQESRAQAVLHLRIAAEQAVLLGLADIDDLAEPAPVYVP
jgi:hypothetical protein